MRTAKKNILKSLLFVCSGLVIATIAFAATRLIDPPGSPGRPSAYNISEDGCIISFLPPRSNGGSKITKYWVYFRRETEYLWVRKGATIYLEDRIDGMIKGSRAEFRVTAENFAGEGKPSLNSDLITFINPF